MTIWSRSSALYRHVGTRHVAALRAVRNMKDAVQAVSLYRVSVVVGAGDFVEEHAVLPRNAPDSTK